MTFITAVLKNITVTIAVIFIFIVLIALAWPSPEKVNREVNSMYSDQAERSIEEYHLAARHGSPVEQCVAAQQVATAYRMANDEKNYQDWREIQRIDCEAAGVPF